MTASFCFSPPFLAVAVAAWCVFVAYANGKGSENDEPSALPHAASAAGTNLVVNVEGLRNRRGVLAVNLFRGSGGFPSDDSRAWAKQIVAISSSGAKTVSVRFAHLPPGDWAVVLLHDENQNHKMDTGLFGIPKEGFGASNNPKARTGPPKFRDAAFPIAPGETVRTITIKPIYMGRL